MFEKIINNKKNKEILINAIEHNQINHSFIFIGAQGTQKREMALEFAKVILCESDKKPCDNCISCNKINNNNHPDFMDIFPQENNIKINQIRQIQRQMLVKPYESEHKIFLINNCETMGIPAQNALLKSLEEPNKGIIVILTSTSKQRIASTILSRCQILLFNPLGINAFKNELIREYNISEEKSYDIFNLTQGCIGRAKHIINNSQEIDNFNEIKKYLKLIIKGEFYNIFNLSKWIKENNMVYEDLLNYILIIFRNIIYAKISSDFKLFDKAEYDEMASYLNIQDLYSIIEDIIELQTTLRYNINSQLQLETVLLKIQEGSRLNDKSRRNSV
ncbi:MAG: ATP-binding protein [Eubacteriaceae bacterium]